MIRLFSSKPFYWELTYIFTYGFINLGIIFWQDANKI